jgi:N-acylneuraminate cytidylyltransferase
VRLAIIPARGQSKRIPRKNIRDFCGKPMIAWSIEAALGSACFDRVIVSTDDDEIAGVAAQFGAEVPFRRPADLADDHTGTTDVIAHASRWAQDQGWAITAVCCLYPTAPMVSRDDLAQGLALFESGDWSYVFTATDFAAPIFRAFHQVPEGGVEMFWPERFATRAQDLPRALHDAGQFYWGRPRAWIESEVVFGPRSAPLIIPRWRVQDIDTPDDWRRAEALFIALGSGET